MTSPRHRRVGNRTRLAAAALALAAVTGGLAACRVEPKSLTVQTVVSGLDKPWDMAFTPQNDLYFTEKVGRINVRLGSPGHAVRTLAAPGDVLVAGEGGMMGIAVDPGFASNRRIYTCFQSSAPAGAANDVRVVRWRVNADVTALTDRADIVTGIPSATGRHTGCRPRFGPDGRLWIGTGDAAVGSVPQDPRSLGGKVLRVDTDGKGVAGNPGGALDPRIYTFGHRNVQGIAFSGGGKAYSIEHGPDRDDEVNRLFSGANYGWDPRPAGGATTYDESRPMTDKGRYPDARSAVWSSGSPTIAPSGGTFLQGDQWGGWHNTLAIAVLKAQQLRVLAFESSGNAVSQQWAKITDRGRLRSAVQGPDGNLYLAQDASPGSILRVTPG